MKKAGFIVFLLFVFCGYVDADMVETNDSTITVTGRQIDAGWAGNSAGNVVFGLDFEPRILVNSQGGYGGQNDLSIRGSSFSGAGLTIGGLALRNPQTEHFNLELPLSSQMFYRPRVMTGLDQVRSGESYLTGSVEMEIRPIIEHAGVDVGFGDGGWNWQSFLYEFPLSEEVGSRRLAGSVFAVREVADSIDSADNDLDRTGFGGQLQWQADSFQADLCASAQEKDFGATGYYGVPVSLDAEEHIEDSIVFGSARWGGRGDEEYARASGMLRLIDDVYKINPGIYTNQTESTVVSCGVDGRRKLVQAVELNWRVSGNMEDIDSIQLGDYDRAQGSCLVLPEWSKSDLRVSAGLASEVFTDDGPAFMPQAGVNYGLTEASSVYVSYSGTVRQPSYTELNYDSPGSLGNSGLERQEALNIEAGYKWEPLSIFSCRLAGIGQYSENTVDWVRESSESTKWTAMNLGDVDTVGVEMELWCVPAEDMGVSTSYTWLHKENDADIYASRYVLDYPEHLVQVSAIVRLCSYSSLVAGQSIRWQTDNPMRGSDEFSAIGRIALQNRLVAFIDGTLTVAVDNIWDDDFEDYAGAPVSGRMLSVQLSVVL